MNKESFLAFPQEITECLKSGNVDEVEFQSDFTDILLSKPICEFLPLIVSELTDNCMDKGAKTIKVKLTDTTLTVEDDVVETDPEAVLGLINKIMESGEITTTKDQQRQTEDICPGGGMGIAKLIMGCLNKVGGTLDYLSEEGRIIANVKWE